MKIAIVSRDERKGFDGRVLGGRAVAVKVVGSKLGRRVEGVSCLWSGNEGFSAAVATVREQLNSRYESWTEAEFDEAGDLVA